MNLNFVEANNPGETHQKLYIKENQMTKKEVLKDWLNKPKVRYGTASSFHVGYGDGWDWVKNVLNPSITKNATFQKALDFSFAEIDRWLKAKSEKRKLGAEECTVYFVGYRDGVQDAVDSIRKRISKLNKEV